MISTRRRLAFDIWQEVKRDLLDRQGIKQQLRSIDSEVEKEMNREITSVILGVLKRYQVGRPEKSEKPLSERHPVFTHDLCQARVQILEDALEKIVNPNKRDHQEPPGDYLRQLGCVMNIAEEALTKARSL